MSIAEMNTKLRNGAVVKICPWQAAYSNQCQVQVKGVANGRTVTYTWEGLDGSEVEKTAQVNYMTWNYITESLEK